MPKAVLFGHPRWRRRNRLLLRKLRQRRSRRARLSPIRSKFIKWRWILARYGKASSNSPPVK
jgi:type II secretory pathway predicted ATPase ExeA